MFLFVTAHKRSGTYIYTRKLTIHLPRESYSIMSSSLNLWHNLVIPVKAVVHARKEGRTFVIVEYEYSMFGPPIFTHIMLILLLLLARLSFLKPIIVLHGVLHPEHISSNSLGFIARAALVFFYRFIRMLSSRLYVLNGTQYKLLSAYGVVDKVHVIPHGADLCVPSERPKDDEDNKRRIKVFFHGFLRPSKGLDELLDAINILSRAGLDVHLEIWGTLPHQVLKVKSERVWLRRFLEKVNELKRRNLITLHVKFASEEELQRAAMSSDVIVLPYKDSYFESSGVLHLFMDCGKPFILSRTPRFYSDVSLDEALFVKVDGLEIARAIIMALVKKDFLAHKLRTKARKRLWKRISLVFAMDLLEGESR